MENQFQIEQNEILETILKPLYSMWSLPLKDQKEHLQWATKNTKEFILELYITSNCNQKCSYCYLVQHGDELYPKEIRDPETILKNLKIYFNYSLEKGYNYNRIDLFSGEIWGTPFGDKVLDIILLYLNKGLQIGSVIIPTNFSFCENESTIEKMEHYISSFSKLNCRLGFSCSMDGFVIDKLNRPFADNREKTKEYYTRILSFCKAHGFGFHPMIAANNIELQKENYDFWIEILKEFGTKNNLRNTSYGRIMQLVVRNNDWTIDSIKQYLDWLNYVLDKDVEVFFDGKYDEFISELYARKLPYTNNYFPYSLAKEYYGYACTMGHMLTIRLGDLAIAPCHRMSYEKFIIGRFMVEDDKIIGLKADNIQMASAIYLTNAISKPHCDLCPIRSYCMKGCIGSQYEALNEPFCPIPCVCELHKATFMFLYMKYMKLGAFKDNYFKSLFGDEIHKAFKQLAEKEHNKLWINYIQTLI